MVVYPLARVQVEVNGTTHEVEVAVAMLMGTDVPVPYYLEQTHMRLLIKRMLQVPRIDAHVLLFKYVRLLLNCNFVVCV